MSNDLNSALTIMTMSNAKAFANGSQHPSPFPSTLHSESAPPAKDMETNTNTKDNMTPPPLATKTVPGPSVSALSLRARASRGIDLLFAASTSNQCQLNLKPKVTTEAEAEADSVNALAEVPFPSTITVVSTGTGTGTGRAEPGDESVGKSASCDEEEEEGAPSSEHDGEKPTIDADAVNDKDQKDNVKTFPQVLQIILNTPEYESIAHWLPDGLSFLIVDKQRFSDEILPKYFHRVSLYHSFIRKLNRYGFRRVKGSCKGEESSFAHNNFVRDKPWLCLKMNCQSKPSYHKAPLATMMPTSHQAAVEAIDSIRFANAAGAGVIAMPTAISPPSIGVGVGGMMDADSRAFVATSRPTSYMPAGASHSAAVLPMTTAAIDPTIASTIAGATAAAIQERQLQLQLQLRLRLEAPILTVPVHSQQRQRILHEMQMRTLQMRQCHRRQVQLQLQLQRLHEMSAYDEDHVHSTSSSYGSYIQSSLMAQCTSDMLRRNIFN